MGILPLPYSARIDAINDLIDGFIKLDGGMPQAVTLANIAVSGSASDLTSGTLADARLSSNVPLKNAENVFSVNNTFSQGIRFGNAFQRNIYINHDPSNRGRIEWRESNGFSNGWMGMSTTGLDINPDTAFGYRLNVNSDLNVTGTTTFNGNVSAGFNVINSGIYNANGTTHSGFYEWRRNNVRHAFMGYDATNDVTLNLESGGKFVVTTSMQVGGTVQVGGASGPLLKNSSGQLQVRNSGDTAYAEIRSLRSIVHTGLHFLDQISETEHWFQYKIVGDPKLYIRDMINSRMQVSYTPGVDTPTALTQFHSRVAVDGTLTVSSNILALIDVDSSHILGRNRFGSPHADWAMFSHYDYGGTNTYSVGCGPLGQLALNAHSGQAIIFGINDVAVGKFTATGNLVLNNMLQIGGASGPLLKNSSGTLQVRNSTDSAFVGIQVAALTAEGLSSFNGISEFNVLSNFHSSLRVSGANGIQFSGTTPVSTELWREYTANTSTILYLRDMTNSRMHATYTQGTSVSTASTRFHSNVTADGVLTASEGLSVPGSNLGISWNGSTTDRLVANTGPGGNFVIRLAGVDVIRVIRDSQLTDSLFIENGNTKFAGHITSAFQSLSADPSTLDISSGMSRLVKNTTSGEIRHWVNDGGTMKKSPAFT